MEFMVLLYALLAFFLGVLVGVAAVYILNPSRVRTNA